MDRTQKADEQLAILASHLTSRRADILQAWRTSVDADSELTAPSSLPRTQFNDHIPELLNAFENRLHVLPRSESKASDQQRTEVAVSIVASAPTAVDRGSSAQHVDDAYRWSLVGEPLASGDERCRICFR